MVNTAKQQGKRHYAIGTAYTYMRPFSLKASLEAMISLQDQWKYPSYPPQTLVQYFLLLAYFKVYS